MQTRTDHVGRQIQVLDFPQRIISLCPSQTEAMYLLGAGQRVVGRTKFCVHPKTELAAVPVVGGTKQVRRVEIERLQPDLILAEKEEQTPELVEDLARSWPVFVTDVQSLAHEKRMLRDVADLLGTPEVGDRIAAAVHTAWEGLPRLNAPLRTAYLIWWQPVMAVAEPTFIASVLAHLGFQNVLLDTESRYPQLSLEELASRGTELVLLSSEPFPFGAKHAAEIQAVLPQARVELVDGEAFSWYGGRVLATQAYLAQLIERLNAQ